MTASMKFKGLLAGVATFALIGAAMAQGAAVDKAKSAPVGAGQQSTQGTPMGTTGTPGGAPGGAPAPTMKPSVNSGTAAAPSSSMTTSGGSSAGSTMSSDTPVAANTGTRTTQRRARADRN